MDRQIEGHTEFDPCVLQDIRPLGPLPKKWRFKFFGKKECCISNRLKTYLMITFLNSDCNFVNSSF